MRRGRSSGRRTTTAGNCGSDGPTVKTIIGERLIPGFLDRYLAHKGFKSQQSDTPLPSHRPDNLFNPVDDERDHGASGLYDDQAHGHSLQLALAEHRRALFGAGLAASAASAAAVAIMRDGND